MRCDDLRDRFDTLWEGGDSSPEVREHVAECASCARYLQDVQLAGAGFRVLKQEAPPEPSTGFAERLVRQLGELTKQPALGEFFEQAGRRFVYATLVLDFLMLLVLALSATGPVRGQGPSDMLMPAQEAILHRPDPLGEISSQDVSDALPAEPSATQPEVK